VESDEETFEILKSNLQAIGKKIKVSLYHQKNEDYKKSHDQRVWLFSNLPYGKQVKSETLKSMFATMKIVFKPQMIAVFHPEPLKDNEALSVLHLPVVNGGLKVTLSILTYKK
jgi:23S rRNA G2445 N2-methylase RlmL